MLGKHTHREAVAVVVVASDIPTTSERARLIDQRLHQVRLPHGVDALQQTQHALEAETRVDTRLRQQGATAIWCLVVLHENQVPKLHETITMRVAKRSAIGTECRAAIDMDLATRATRAGVAHLPEVVFVAESLNAIHRNTDLFVPDRFRFVVAVVNRDPQPVAIDTKRLGGQLPAPRDDFLLEVVAETEVAQHLEEDEMPLGATDIVEVVVLATSTRALLRADRARVGRHLVANEVRLERHHARNGEQDRRVVRDQAGRRHVSVALADEVVDEGRTKFICGLRHGTH